MFVGVTACGKTEFLLRLLETVYKNQFEFIVILCPTILDNKTYLSRKWILDDKKVFIVCDMEGNLNEWINPIQAGGGGYNVPPYRFFPCCAATACSRLMKLSDF